MACGVDHRINAGIIESMHCLLLPEALLPVTEHSNAATTEHFKTGHVVGGESMRGAAAGAQA